MNPTLKKWLPWIAVAAVAVIVIIIIAVSGGGDDAAGDTTTTSEPSGDTTTTVADTTTTTGGDTTTTAPPVAFTPIPLQVGAMMPQTGALSGIVAALEEPIRMATEEINAVSPGLLTVDYADTGTDPAIASTNLDQFLTGNYQAIIGPAATGVTLGVFDKINESQLPMCSGSNTGAALSASKYDPYYNRTAPSDNIQAPALGDLILQDGETSVAVVWRSDEYGRGFGEALAQYLKDSGASVPLAEGYDQNAASFSDLASSIIGENVTAVAMISFDEGGQILQDLKGAGFDGQIYVADGFKDNVTVDSVGGNAALLEGIRGTAPSSAPANGDPTFPDRFAAFAPDTPTIFSAHFYDCTVVTVLAAQEAQSNDPTVFVNNMISVTEGGEKCTSFADCFALLQEGADIDYDGASGPLDFGPNGEPTVGTYDLFEYDADGAPQTFDQIVGSI
ncbi:MAG: ABC transporter substrate-binding protein [Acidimicrobiia bacterium]|nr:ABC transporter substrate-binding protein [Acidimicrobiia bacterium]